MRSVRWSRVLLLPLAVACERPVAPALAEGAQRFDPPAVYQLWWDMTLECSGRRAPLSAVHWYVVPGAQTVEVNGERYAGYWTSSGNTIVLAERSMLYGPLVRHEMLHSLLEVGSHPRAEFLGRCSGVVDCDDRCVADAGPLPPVDPAAVGVAPDALEIGIVVTPAAPSRSQYGGYFTMMVTAHNPLNQPVLVTLPPSHDAGPPLTFEYRIEEAGGYTASNDRLWDDGVIRFAAGETKRRVFDFRAVREGESTLDGGLRPGAQDLRGAFGGRWAPATTITLSSP